MNTSLNHLTIQRQEEIRKAVQIIVKAVQPEKIILFGVYGPGGDYGAIGVLQRTSLPRVLDAYDLLVITRTDDRRSDYELQDIIENRCRDRVAVTALVHDIGYINKRLSEGQYFFALLDIEGILLYDSRRVPLVKACMPNIEEVKWLAQRDFERWGQQARAFFRSAEFNLDISEWKIATFLLHQAAEQAYQAILLVFTGYKPTTHNLDKLRRYTNRFSVELAMIFPRDNPEEDDVFRLLSSGYVDARYKEEFMITEEEVRLLLERVRRLLDITERVCMNHFISLGKKERI
jgi:HEPN domain-containing protein